MRVKKLIVRLILPAACRRGYEILEKHDRSVLRCLHARLGVVVGAVPMLLVFRFIWFG